MSRAARQHRRRQQRRVNPEPPELVDAYRAAVSAFNRAREVPAWRPFKRRKLVTRARIACAHADKLRDALAAQALTGKRALPLYALLESVSAGQAGEAAKAELADGDPAT